MAAPQATVDEVLLTAVKFDDKDEEEEEEKMPAISPDVSGGDFRTRSAHLYADPKMKELKNFIKSHRHEERLRMAAELEERQPVADSPKAGGPLSPLAKSQVHQSKQAAEPKRRKGSIRSEGCAAVDRHMKRLASETASLPRIGACCSEDPPRYSQEERGHHVDQGELKRLEGRKAQMRKMDVFSTRLQWRSSMDYSLRRLLVDLELARDERLKEYSNQARCENLDKMYDWYTTMGMKEARKERIAPPYIRFRGDGVVMAGSLRPTPMWHQVTREKGAPRSLLQECASAPTLQLPAATAGGGDLADRTPASASAAS
eukprot:TRINITY_DN38370_c0_g1_i1.p1 TRINITY_DN38370_c0_g1~~TRINITY_DN38370_c0_g1_i1.p1  ORF type:complete len:316 (+),score=85.48 TRINITY_DN38370_c0_g1_i1:165-1112(+)